LGNLKAVDVADVVMLEDQVSSCFTRIELVIDKELDGAVLVGLK
jgi:hypothetical protein